MLDAQLKCSDVLFIRQVGDGTTTVVLLAGEFLKEAKPFVEDGVHPQNLIRSYRTASNLVRFEATFVLFKKWNMYYMKAS